MPFELIREDITRMKVDAIVNAANTDLAMGGGVCGAIFAAAGAKRMQEACDRVAPVRTGFAAITPGFDLPCRFVIHAAGPVYRRYDPEASERLLRSAYTEAMKLGKENGCASMAFPLISSGIYGYPKAEALDVAVSAIRDYLLCDDMEVYLAVFDDEAFSSAEKRWGDVESYIDEHYASDHADGRRTLVNAERLAMNNAADYDEAARMLSRSFTAADKRAGSIDERLAGLDEPFSETLLRIIDGKGKTDAEVYKRANLDRKLFSKIRTGKGYTPGKRTILALAVALELDIEETDRLLARAGYALSHSRKFDVIVEYFIISKKYDIFEINEALFKYDEPLLGG